MVREWVFIKGMGYLLIVRFSVRRQAHSGSGASGYHTGNEGGVWKITWSPE
jgi:hypothetical protein